MLAWPQFVLFFARPFDQFDGAFRFKRGDKVAVLFLEGQFDSGRTIACEKGL